MTSIPFKKHELDTAQKCAKSCIACLMAEYAAIALCVLLSARSSECLVLSFLCRVLHPLTIYIGRRKN